MSLQLIIGNSGSGKTTEVLNRVIEESMANPTEHFLIVVPEQFTMQTQKDVVRLHPYHSVLNIEILSFMRLSFRVFSELGTAVDDVLTDTGKNLILRRVAEENIDKLKVLKSCIKKAGYINEIRSFMSELSQYGIDEEELLTFKEAAGFSKRFEMKIDDIELLYRAFKDYIRGNYITSEEILERLTEVADRSLLLRNCTVVLDGFTGFTPVQNDFLRKLFPIAKKVYATVTMDTDISAVTEGQMQELFCMSRKMSTGLVKLAEETGTEIDPPVLLSETVGRRYKNPGKLSFLERNIFREYYHPENHGRTYEGSDDDRIELLRFRDRNEEVEYIAAHIVKEVRERGRRFSDFAVICSSVDSYTYTVENTFSKYDISLFTDTKLKIAGHPFLAMIKRLFILHIYNFKPEDVLKYLKCGIELIPEEEIDDLDYYISSVNMRGFSAYSKPLKRTTNIFTADMLQVLDEKKNHFMDPLLPFFETLKKKNLTVKEISEALRQLFNRLDMEKKLMDKAEEYREKNDPYLEKEYENIYGLVDELLDRTDALLGEHIITVQDYLKIMESGFDTLKVGLIPPKSDSVIFGDIERTRLKDIKVLFLIGASDSMIPKIDDREGLLSGLEREKLKDEGYELAPTGRERAFRQRFYLYLALSKPEEGLIITSPKIDNEGKSARPSYLYQEIAKLFPDVAITDGGSDHPVNLVTNEEMAKDRIINLLSQKMSGKLSGEEEELLAVLLKQINTSDKEFLRAVLNNLFYRHIPEKLEDAVNSGMIEEKLSGSVSKLETYAQCPFKYFLNYLIRLKEWEVDEISPIDRGNFYHEVLKDYGDELKSRNLTWHTISDEQSEEFLEKSIAKVYEKNDLVRFEEDPEMRFKLEDMKNTMRATMPVISSQVKRSRFEPAGFEVDFRTVQNEMELEALKFQLEKGQMNFVGKIDRMDTYETEDGNILVKITDYKSGDNVLSPTETFGGTDIQMFLYMDAALEMVEKSTGKKAVPAGVFYVHINPEAGTANEYQDPDQLEEKAENETYKRMTGEGLLNADINSEEVLGTKGSSRGAKLPLSTEEWETLRGNIRDIITEEGNRMQRGDIDCNPYRSGQYNGCSFCSYHSICHFDSKIPGYSYRDLEKRDSFKDTSADSGELIQ